jgi:hypothetical protein
MITEDVIEPLHRTCRTDRRTSLIESMMKYSVRRSSCVTKKTTRDKVRCIHQTEDHGEILLVNRINKKNKVVDRNL